MVKQPIEIKSAPNSKGKFNKAVETGRLQILGHLGKRLLYAFDFGGAGENKCAVGICLTHVSIEVIKMSLSGVGTKEVDLRAIGTGLVPLLGAEFVTQDHQKEELESVETAGFVLLAGALIHALPQKFDLGGISVTQIDHGKEALTAIDYLGSGAFSNVVKLRDDEFMKMPKSAAVEKILTREATILRKLQSVEDGCFSIPRLVVDTDKGTGVSSIRSVICGEISDMVGLRLRGVVGLPLHRVPGIVWTHYSKFIIQTMFEALDFAHRQSIYHMDIQPGNIIVGVDDGRPCHAMLSDWGCSVDGTVEKTLTSFRGCTPYAHDRLLRTFKGTLGPELDFASLAYTLDHVCTGSLRWLYEFDSPLKVTTGDLIFRRTHVSEWLSEARPPSGPAAELQLILTEENRAALRSACCPRSSNRTY
jgi:hypothetical protein